MQRYYLNLFNDIDATDYEGTEFPDQAAAKVRSIEDARGLMAEHVRLGQPINLSHRMEVADGDGRVLAVIPFRELLTLIDGEPACFPHPRSSPEARGGEGGAAAAAIDDQSVTQA